MYLLSVFLRRKNNKDTYRPRNRFLDTFAYAFYICICTYMYLIH